MSVCLCVCPSVCLSLQKSAVTFEPLDGSVWNFQGPLNSPQVIFGRVTWTPGPGPRKSGFPPNLSPQVVLGQGFVLHLYGIETTRRTKSWKRNFEIWPLAGENGAGGANQNFKISIFCIKVTPAKIRRWSLLVLCNFLIRGTAGDLWRHQNWLISPFDT